MLSSQFSDCISNLRNYFNNEEKWKQDEEGYFIYYKGKRNLKELEYILELVFGYELEILDRNILRNESKVIIGGEIVGKISVEGNFNGMYQGTGGSGSEVEYVKFSLWEYGYSFTNSQKYENLKRS